MLTTIKNLLEGVLEPNKVAYRAFPAEVLPVMPYIVYMSTGAENFGADNKVYYTSDNVRIELYTELKDLALEQSLESALNDAEIFWSKNETYINDEQCYFITYDIEV